MGISDTDEIDLTSLETLGKTSAGSKVLKDIQDGTYFAMPLVRNQQITRGASLYRTGSDKIKLLIQESRDFFDGRELEEDDRINISKNNTTTTTSSTTSWRTGSRRASSWYR